MKIFLLPLLFFFLKSAVQSGIKPVELSCNHFASASGVLSKPVFGWKLHSGGNDQRQTAYRLLVASSEKACEAGIGDVWDSDKILSDNQLNIAYGGKALASSSIYYWKVKVWDKDGNASSWSRPSKFITGLINSNDFKGTWITSNKKKGQPLPLFRKSFTIKEKPQKAVIHISGLGYYELFVNGKKVGDHVLDPGQTNYDDYAFYVTYNIDSLLKPGENVVGVMLGDGWYNQDIVWGGNLTYGKPMLWCQLDMAGSSGAHQIVSDTSWQLTDGPIQSSNVYAGETYDARKEIPGWSTPAKRSAMWTKAIPATRFPPSLKPQNLQPIKKMKELSAKRFYRLPDGRYVFDMGQNFAGWNRLKIQAPAGTEITLKMAEELANDTLDHGTTGIYAIKVIQTERYTCKGGGLEVWEPRFTYHGFRYVEVSGLLEPPGKDLLTGIVVYSSMPVAGSFASSNPQLNQLHELCKWTLTGNLHSVPTDCPAREKCGWLGDAHAMAPSTIYNLDMQNFWLKFMDDIHSTAKPELNTIRYTGLKDPRIEKYRKPAGIPTMVAPGKRSIGAASPDWGTAIVQLPWYLYKYYANSSALETFYPDMKQWVEFVGALAKERIVYIGLGDWCPPGTIDQIDCPVPLSSTAFHYNDLIILKQAAAILGKTADSKAFSDSAALVRNAFIQKFYNPVTHSFGSHTANAMALEFGLVPEGDETLVANAIVKTSTEQFGGFMYAGIFGLQRLFTQLSNHRNEQAAFNILNKKGDNSFEWMWKAHQATTLWEVLPVSAMYIKNKPEIVTNRSHNHPMQAGFDAYFFNGVGGINPDVAAPGFKKIILAPRLLNQLKWAKCDYNSVYGKIVSSWKWEGNTLVWEVEIPANTTASAHLPLSFVKVFENKKPVQVKLQGDHIEYEVTSGKHRFLIQQ